MLLVFGACGGVFCLIGVGLVYLAVVDSTRWAAERRLTSSGFDPGPGWGAE